VPLRWRQFLILRGAGVESALKGNKNKPMKPRIAYFAHDLVDASVHRRVRMLLDGGADLLLFGYRRTPEPVPEVHGVPAIDLGQTHNSRLLARALAILRERFVTRRYAHSLRGVSAIVARNLDVLVIGSHALACADPGVPLIYECLDIHGKMLGTGLPSRALRGLEAFYLKRCAGLIVSSPGFMREYFERFSLSKLNWRAQPRPPRRRHRRRRHHGRSAGLATCAAARACGC
jgi:hypothetical protein